MKLRDDPDAASAMAGVLTQSNSFKLTGMIGRRPTDSELYMAHFMGVGGAAKLIANAEDNPQASGARLFPNAAAANRSIFYDHDGRARSVSEVYSVLNSRYASAANSQATRTAMAPSAARRRRASRGERDAGHAADRQRRLSVEFSERARVTPVSATSPTTVAANAPIAGVPFAVSGRRTHRSRSRRRCRNCGATAVAHLGRTPRPRSHRRRPTSGAPQPLDLFSDRSGTF